MRLCRHIFSAYKIRVRVTGTLVVTPAHHVCRHKSLTIKRCEHHVPRNQDNTANITVTQC